MQVLRFLRNGRAAAAPAESPNDALGLDAFATEAPPPKAAAGAVPPANNRLRLAVIALGVVAILQSVPAFLWIQSQIWPEVPVAAAAVAPPVASAPAPPEPAMAAPPCAPAPAPETIAPARAETAVAPARAAAPALVAGLVSVTAPVPMHVFRDGQLIGTTETDTIMLPVGAHDLEIVSEAVGFRARRTVNVQAGRTSEIRLEAPRVPLHVNALPWAEVWIDNQRVGETPIGNLQQTIGTHEVVFRHPELGERRTTVLVTLKEPARVSMDLRKK